MLAIDSTRPLTLKGVPQALGLADSAERFAHHFFDELVDS